VDTAPLLFSGGESQPVGVSPTSMRTRAGNVQSNPSLMGFAHEHADEGEVEIIIDWEK